MKLFRNNRIVAGGTGGSLAVLFVLLSLGARSVDFHWLMHGDDVKCSLPHPSACHSDEGRDSAPESPPPDRDCPLEPFCRAGFWHSIQASELVLEHLLSADLSCLLSILPEGRVRLSDGPPRAPPVLV